MVEIKLVSAIDQGEVELTIEEVRTLNVARNIMSGNIVDDIIIPVVSSTYHLNILRDVAEASLQGAEVLAQTIAEIFDVKHYDNMLASAMDLREQLLVANFLDADFLPFYARELAYKTAELRYQETHILYEQTMEMSPQMIKVRKIEGINI